MLVRPEKLNSVLNKLSERNQFFQEYNRLSKEESQKFPQAVLCFWLGLTTAFSNFPIETELLKNLYTGFYCVLILEKAISILPSPDGKILNTCLQELLAFYNENYSLFIDNPQQFFSQFKSIITKVDELEAKSTSHQVILQTKKDCLTIIDHFLEKKTLICREQLPLSSRQASNDLISLYTLFQGENLSIVTQRILTLSSKLHHFYPQAIHADHYNIQKIFIEAKDRTVLSGLLIQNLQQQPFQIVLMLAGSFQSEDNYFKDSYLNFQKLFGSDIIFINHRNRSIRSNRAATNMNELANDVIEFVHYFNKKYQQIVLYGMCGGSPHMILAANILTRKEVPYKLIIDRFFTKYSNYSDYKTIKRIKDYGVFKFNPLFESVSFMGLLFILVWFRIFFVLLLKVTNTDIHFGNLLLKLPENDILVLQAKSKKCEGESKLECTDLFIHPKNDIRTALKNKRHQNKNLLKQLVNDCKIVSLHPPIKTIFLKLASYFNQCLQLIDNEKLTLPISNGKRGNNLHSHKLYQLTTRNHLPLNQFLMGFFSKPVINKSDLFSEITIYTVTEIATLLQANQEIITTDIQKVANALNRFLCNFKQHENYIFYMANRLINTKLDNMKPALNDMLASDLFQSLHYKKFKFSHYRW